MLDLELETLLDYLKVTQGCDLTVYKRSTLGRRLGVRMQKVGIKGYNDYLEYLKGHAEELALLLDSIFINVTAFFRDREAWDYLAKEIIPKIIASKEPNEPIRIWSAGCASGEETYTLAMVLAEALGMEQCLQQVQIYATDVDETALSQARQGSYTSSEVAGVPPALLEKYFEPTDVGYVIKAELRSCIIFAHHNLINDPPISKLDLLVCRNTLIYFHPEAQAKILVRFHFGLKELGFLFLGEAETLFSRQSLFTPVSLKHRFFTKASKLSFNDYLLLTNKTPQGKAAKSMANDVEMWQAVLEKSPVAQIVVEEGGKLALANERARVLLSLTSEDLGRFWPGLPFITKFVGLGSRLKQVLRDRRPTSLKNVECSTANGTVYLDVQIAPILDSSGSFLGVSLTFTCVTRSKQLSEELERSKWQLAEVSQKLESTFDELTKTKMELECLKQELEIMQKERQ